MANRALKSLIAGAIASALLVVSSSQAWAQGGPSFGTLPNGTPAPIGSQIFVLLDADGDQVGTVLSVGNDDAGIGTQGNPLVFGPFVQTLVSISDFPGFGNDDRRVVLSAKSGFFAVKSVVRFTDNNCNSSPLLPAATNFLPAITGHSLIRNTGGGKDLYVATNDNRRSETTLSSLSPTTGQCFQATLQRTVVDGGKIADLDTVFPPRLTLELH